MASNSNLSTNFGLENMLKVVGVGCSRVMFHPVWRDWGTPQNLSVRMADL